MSKVKVGVAGAGVFAGYHAGKFAGYAASRLVGIYDIDLGRAQTLADRHAETQAVDNLDVLLGQIDALVVATPAISHYYLAKSALDAGKHVLCEKPLALFPDQARALAALAESKGLVLQVGHQERLVMNALGIFTVPARPISLSAQRLGPSSGRALDVSVTYDLMIHDLDMALEIFDEMPRVRGAIGRTLTGGAFDEVEAELVFPSGAHAYFKASRMSEERSRKMRADFGPHGLLDIDFLDRSVRNTTDFGLNLDFASKVPDPLGAADQIFLDAILKHVEPVCSGEKAAQAVELAYAIDAAAGGAPSRL